MEEVTDEPLYRDRACGIDIGKAGLVATIRVASSEHDKRALPPGPEMDVEAIRAMLASPSRLREIAFLGELLKPPVALRPRRPFR